MDVDTYMKYHVVAINPTTGRVERISNKPFLSVTEAGALRDQIPLDLEPKVVYDSQGIEKYLSKAESRRNIWDHINGD